MKPVINKAQVNIGAGVGVIDKHGNLSYQE